MKKIILLFLMSQLSAAGFVFAADEDENRELGIEMKSARKPTLQEAGVKAQEKINKYNKAKKKIIEMFNSSVIKQPGKGPVVSTLSLKNGQTIHDVAVVEEDRSGWWFDGGEGAKFYVKKSEIQEIKFSKSNGR